MATPAATLRTDTLRQHVMQAAQHGTDLIADLQALARAFDVLVPELADATKRERWAEVARLTGLDVRVPDELAALVETLADILAGLTSADGGRAWLGHQRARLDAGEDDSAA
jgi:hypothetical protein